MERGRTRARVVGYCALGALVAALCACVSPPDAPPSLSVPRPLVLGDRSDFDRETTLPPSREVLLTELGVTFRVPTVAEVEHRRANHFDAVYFDIGTELPVACHILHERRQLANFLAYNPMQLQGLPAGEDPPRRIAHVGTGAEAGHAFLTLHWLHPQDGLFGVVKQAAANAYGHTVYCRHPEPGYEQTFERAFRTLLSTFFSERGVDPYYAEIVAIRIGDRPIGIETTEMREAFGGRSRIDYHQALLLPRGSASIVATDSQRVSFSSEAGDLIRARSVQWQAGILASNLVLQGTGPGQWRVGGRFNAQNYDESFEVPEPIRSPLGVALDMRDRLVRDGSRARLDYLGWLPDDDPARPTPISIQVTGLEDSGFYTGLQLLGERERSLVLDSDGSVVSGAIELGPATMHMERIWVAGAY